MALWNNSRKLSPLGLRLKELVDEKNKSITNEEDIIQSPRDLAKHLYSLGLVHVNTGDNFNDEGTDKNNAIGSVEKKIVRHIKTGRIVDHNGEFVIAYSKFFNCSSDYILGLTKIKSTDIEVRRICELTGLSEAAVNNLVSGKLIYDQLGKNINYYWSVLLESSLYKELAFDWLEARVQAMNAAGNEHNLQIATKLLEQGISKEHLGEKLDPYALDDAAKTYRDAYEGILYKLYRKIVNLIEDNIKSEYEDTLQWLIDISAESNKLN